MNKNHEFYHIMPAIPENMNLTRLSIFCLNCKYNNIRLWHRTVLAALRGAYSFAPAQAAIFIAVKAARVPHGPAAVVRRRRSLKNGDSRDKAPCIHGWLAYAFVRLRRPKAPLREPFLPLLAPPKMPAFSRWVVVVPYALTLAPPAVKDSFNTIFD